MIYINRLRYSLSLISRPSTFAVSTNLDLVINTGQSAHDIANFFKKVDLTPTDVHSAFWRLSTVFVPKGLRPGEDRTRSTGFYGRLNHKVNAEVEMLSAFFVPTDRLPTIQCIVAWKSNLKIENHTFNLYLNSLQYLSREIIVLCIIRDDRGK